MGSAGSITEQTIARFAGDLDGLVPAASRLGIAVSGGPDSLALLLLAAAALPGRIEAATVDHCLREGSAGEAQMVARLCAERGIPHAILPIEWDEQPAANIQSRAREARYAALEEWANGRGLAAVATAHHLDDQAETFLMRLARGAGVAGLAGIRSSRRLSTASKQTVAIVRPLLRWRRDELRAIVAAAGIEAVDDPANRDPRHERTGARAFLTANAWPEAERLAAAAANLADAEEALQFAATRLFDERHSRVGDAVVIDPSDLPREFRRRLLLIAFERNGAQTPRGRNLMRLITLLEAGRTGTLAGFKVKGGERWRITLETPRKH